ncbi:hypothetical protein M8C17_21080 [Micromonospora sp. RHAY321]|uniref:hypothetical protein n=1 Tax=Micromonospora sp. RHAY321 TaxID=2944807 RepID=UPI00207CB17F|nr:hypothetical protein [Micromonospora sp. RHAY321]MCO1597649.1 hypothetical protein [Micromonospora sp. RHAY321]
MSKAHCAACPSARFGLPEEPLSGWLSVQRESTWQSYRRRGGGPGWNVLAGSPRSLPG